MNALISSMIEQRNNEDILFDIRTPLGFNVRTTVSYWNIITKIKHPAIEGQESELQATLQFPNEIRLSKSDSALYLFYREIVDMRWICAIVKRLNGDGFLVTAYRTDRIKEGKRIWPM